MRITKSNDTTFVNNLAFPLAIEAHARMDETMAVTMAVSDVFARSLCRKQTVHNSNKLWIHSIHAKHSTICVVSTSQLRL